MNTTTVNKTKIQRHWWSKTFIGLFLGLSLAFALVGVFAWIGPGGISAPSKVQFNMWLLTPIWVIVLSTVYLFRSRRQALKFIGGANVAAYALLFFVRIISS